MTQDEAAFCLEVLLAELPAEFSMTCPDDSVTRDKFMVIKSRNVHSVHEALWELQIYFGLQEE